MVSDFFSLSLFLSFYLIVTVGKLTHLLRMSNCKPMSSRFLSMEVNATKNQFNLHVKGKRKSSGKCDLHTKSG
jgi:hypothetical protein